VDMNASARQLYLAFVDIFTSTFSRAQNSDFLTFVATAYEQRRWKLLSQCFRKASKMGLNKVNVLVVLKYGNKDKHKLIEIMLKVER
jgi:midasin